jgi:hypothetical protein
MRRLERLAFPIGVLLGLFALFLAHDAGAQVTAPPIVGEWQAPSPRHPNVVLFLLLTPRGGARLLVHDSTGHVDALLSGSWTTPSADSLCFTGPVECYRYRVVADTLVMTAADGDTRHWVRVH